MVPHFVGRVNALGHWGLRAHVVASNNPAASNGYMSNDWFFYNGLVKLAFVAIPRNGIVDIGVKLQRLSAFEVWRTEGQRCCNI